MTMTTTMKTTTTTYMFLMARTTFASNIGFKSCHCTSTIANTTCVASCVPITHGYFQVLLLPMVTTTIAATITITITRITTTTTTTTTTRTRTIAATRNHDCY